MYLNEGSFKVLIVEDAKIIANALKRDIEKKLGLEVELASTMIEAVNLLEERPDRFFLGLLDLNLPDAQHGEIVDFVIGKDIPVIVFTALFEEEIRTQMLNKKVIDYVLKDSPSTISYLTSLVHRIKNNIHTKTLVVDDSKSSRKHLVDLLRLQRLQVFEAESGVEALALLDKYPDISLVVTDYHMETMDGLELTHNIRKKYSHEDLAIIGVSSYGNNVISAKFIKHGANDFLNKPFLAEEFSCRVSQNLTIVETIRKLADFSIRDALTELHNRRYLMDTGKQLFASATRKQINLGVCLVDIDHFKAVNDTYGHEAGDIVLKYISTILKNNFRKTDIVSRFGGEEFCILWVNMTIERAKENLELLRAKIAAEKIKFGNTTISVTASFGVTLQLEDTLEIMIAKADKKLYEAKNGGRNRVEINYAGQK
ncbi:MAG: diguanylate cyclase [Magnetococcales bacterium]|nr:diguanylate cyclase [Magnetococcales bacterium]